jgi:transcriptional regulator with XRE-family HTH domain
MDISEQVQYVITQIKQLRVQRGISQMELSLRANISQSFLANLEKGKKQPSVLTIIKIATALEVHPKEFFPVKTFSSNKEAVKEEILSLLKYL